MIYIPDNDKVKPLSSRRDNQRLDVESIPSSGKKCWLPRKLSDLWSSREEWSIHSHLTIFSLKLKEITIRHTDTEEVWSEGGERWAAKVVNSIILLSEHIFYSRQPAKSLRKKEMPNTWDCFKYCRVSIAYHHLYQKPFPCEFILELNYFWYGLN